MVASKNRATMFQGYCYGLHVHSTVPLPELMPGNGPPDVIIKEETLAPPSPDRFVNDRFVEAGESEACLSWRNVGSFCARQGREIAYCLHAEVADCWLRQFLLGPVLGVLLHQRGLLVLHGSAVERDGRAFVFLGRKGAGKSTTAAYLHRRGYRLLADDIVAVDTTDPAQPCVVPGLPLIKLWPDAAAALDLDPRALALLNEELPKRAWAIERAGSAAPRPLDRIYALRTGDAPSVARLRGSAALSVIVQNTYAARFIGKAGIPPRHFHQCITVARTANVYHLVRLRSLASLPAALDLLEADPPVDSPLA